MTNPSHERLPDLKALLEARQARISEAERKHVEMRNSAGYKQELVRLDRISDALIELIWHSWLQSSRNPPFLGGSLMYSMTDDTIESIVAIRELVSSGVHNMVRRECRYLLESATKHLYVDQQLPDFKNVTREERVDFLRRKVPRSSIDPIVQVEILLGAGHSIGDFHSDVKNIWSSMAGYVHPSAEQTSERLARAARGAYIGYEDATSLRRLVKEVAVTYDLLGVLWVMAAGPSAAGDILTAAEKKGWPFARSRWLPAVSRYFDYKTERQ